MVPCIHRNGEITGYLVRYTADGIETKDVLGGSTEQTTITGLTPSTEYIIEVAAVNNVGGGPYSDSISKVTQGENARFLCCYGIRSLLADTLLLSSSTTVTSLIISWTLADDVTAIDYTISYFSTDCPSDTYDDITDIPGRETIYTLTGLEEGTEYSITVTATLSGGGTGEDSITATTMAIG